MSRRSRAEAGTKHTAWCTETDKSAVSRCKTQDIYEKIAENASRDSGRDIRLNDGSGSRKQQGQGRSERVIYENSENKINNYADCWLKIYRYYSIHYPFYQMDLHEHPEWEIMYVVHGRCRILCVEDESTPQRENSRAIDSFNEGKEESQTAVWEKEYELREGEYILLGGGVRHKLTVDRESPCRILNVEGKMELCAGNWHMRQFMQEEAFRRFAAGREKIVTGNDDGRLYEAMHALIQELKREADAAGAAGSGKADCVAGAANCGKAGNGAGAANTGKAGNGAGAVNAGKAGNSAGTANTGKAGNGAGILTAGSAANSVQTADDNRGEEREENLLAELLISQIMLLLARQNASARKKKNGGSVYVRRASEYLAENFDQEIRIADAAEFAGISEGYLQRLFKKETGKTLMNKILELRVEKAKLLLETSSLPIIDIAVNVGFNSRQHFAAVFMQLTGCSPMQWRKNGENMRVSAGFGAGKKQ